MGQMLVSMWSFQSSAKVVLYQNMFVYPFSATVQKLMLLPQFAQFMS